MFRVESRGGGFNVRSSAAGRSWMMRLAAANLNRAFGLQLPKSRGEHRPSLPTSNRTICTVIMPKNLLMLSCTSYSVLQRCDCEGMSLWSATGVSNPHSGPAETLAEDLHLSRTCVDGRLISAIIRAIDEEDCYRSISGSGRKQEMTIRVSVLQNG